MASRPKQLRVVLWGVGHTHAHLVQQWRRAPWPGAHLTCVSDFGEATYSGMLPGTLAGLYPASAMRIDLERLCAAAGATLVVAHVEGLDLERRELRFADRGILPYDVLSIGIGSIPAGSEATADRAEVVSVKPMQTLLERWERRLADALAARPDGPVQIVIVGGGAAGFEIACCAAAQLERRGVRERCQLTIVDAGGELLSGTTSGVRRLAKRELARRQIVVRPRTQIVKTKDTGLVTADGSSTVADVIVWATGAAAPPVLGRLGLPTDPRGFLLTRPTLQVVDDWPIFAVGDCGSIARGNVPKAGVYAVRQGPVLWRNLGRWRRGEPLEAFGPQRKFLALYNTGDGRAVLDFRGLAAHGRWCWWLKDAIDRRFVGQYQR